ncbi:MAG TPA: tetratricopeptide repeat protein [Verrucomicrobiae bacterium]|nr:tetratricopeptide repeat protein [Verrucomicrobiae bacterium]
MSPRSVSVAAAFIFFVALSLCATVPSAFGATETNSTPAKDEAAVGDAKLAQHVVQSYQQLQEQQQTLMREIEQQRQDAAANARAVEQAREDAAATAKRNNEEVESRLNQIEQSVTAERIREIEVMQSSHRFTLIMVSVFAGAGFFGMLFLSVFLLRIMNRRTETLIAQFTAQAFNPAFAHPALGPGDTQIAIPNRVDQSTARFLNTIERLEQRIHELEDSSETAPVLAGAAPRKPAEPLPEARPHGDETTESKNGNGSDADSVAATVKNERAERDARIALLLGKGQAHLNLQQADTALTCFNEVIALDSTNAEAFVKKGMALERLGSLDEAIDCYDRAIALDHSMTMAYLSKGGVFNRLERYGEALQCYEQALRAQQKPSIA